MQVCYNKLNQSNKLWKDPDKTTSPTNVVDRTSQPLAALATEAATTSKEAVEATKTTHLAAPTTNSNGGEETAEAAVKAATDLKEVSPQDLLSSQAHDQASPACLCQTILS
jgi:hypothetical protein